MPPILWSARAKFPPVLAYARAQPLVRLLTPSTAGQRSGTPSDRWTATWTDKGAARGACGRVLVTQSHHLRARDVDSAYAADAAAAQSEEGYAGIFSDKRDSARVTFAGTGSENSRRVPSGLPAHPQALFHMEPRGSLTSTFLTESETLPEGRADLEFPHQANRRGMLPSVRGVIFQ